MIYLPRPGVPPLNKMPRDVCEVLLESRLVSVQGTWDGQCSFLIEGSVGLGDYGFIAYC